MLLIKHGNSLFILYSYLNQIGKSTNKKVRSKLRINTELGKNLGIKYVNF